MTRDDRRQQVVDQFESVFLGLMMKVYADVQERVSAARRAWISGSCEAETRITLQAEAELGRLMQSTMKAGRVLIGKVFDESSPAPPPQPPVQNGQAQTPARK